MIGLTWTRVFIATIFFCCSPNEIIDSRIALVVDSLRAILVLNHKLIYLFSKLSRFGS